MADAHMVQQIIKYSDGTETVINYRGVIEDGVLTPDEPEKEINQPEKAEPKGKTWLKKLMKK